MADAKTKKKYYLGTGRRKSSVARVRLTEGSGKIVINGKSLDGYFTEIKDRNAVTDGDIEAGFQKRDGLVRIRGLDGHEAQVADHVGGVHTNKLIILDDEHDFRFVQRVGHFCFRPSRCNLPAVPRFPRTSVDVRR